MIVAIIVLITFLAAILVLIRTSNPKIVVALSLLILLISTFFICYKKPILHKPFSMNVIDYLIKFNSDGTITTTKQTTTTIIKEGGSK